MNLFDSVDPVTQAGPVPRTLGYRMPAEFELHSATWIIWPHRQSDWPGKFEPIPWVYTEIVRHLVTCESVGIIVRSRAQLREVEVTLDRASVSLGQVRFLILKTDRSWLRDTAPTFLVREGRPELGPTGESAEDPVVAVPWRFNGWAKYSDHRRDARVAASLADHLRMTTFDPLVGREGQVSRFVLEGGAIDTDGAGSLLTTEECLLSGVQARNPGLDREIVERVLCDYLGVRKILWLDRGILGDDTHGHVDDIARFVGPRAIVACREPDRGDPNYDPLEANWQRLQAAVDADGLPYTLHSLPMPQPVRFDDQRLPASYANFYIANRVVLVPTFNDPSDRLALNILADLFPTRRVVGIHAVDLVLGLGTLHCLTHQVPLAPEPRDASSLATNPTSWTPGSN